MKIFKGLFIFFIALIPTIIFTVIGIVFSFIFHLVVFKWNTGLKKSGTYFFNMGVGIDKFANISMSPLFNLIMFNKNCGFAFLFGDANDTISYILALNFYTKNLNSFGVFWANFLNFVDEDHMKKAIENKIEKDQEAVERLKTNSWIIQAA